MLSFWPSTTISVLTPGRLSTSGMVVSARLLAAGLRVSISEPPRCSITCGGLRTGSAVLSISRGFCWPCWMGRVGFAGTFLGSAGSVACSWAPSGASGVPSAAVGDSTSTGLTGSRGFLRAAGRTRLTAPLPCPGFGTTAFPGSGTPLVPSGCPANCFTSFLSVTSPSSAARRAKASLACASCTPAS